MAAVVVALPSLVLAFGSPVASQVTATYATTTSSSTTNMGSMVVRPTPVASKAAVAKATDTAALHAVPQQQPQQHAQRKLEAFPVLKQASGALMFGGVLVMIAAFFRNKFTKQPFKFVEFEGTTVQAGNNLAMFSTTGVKTALVVTNKGGGHGEIGFHLALALRAKGLAVQLVNDNGGKDVTSKLPFSEYAQLTAAGVEVFFTDLSQPRAIDSVSGLTRQYDHVFDNENVCQGAVAELAASCGAFYTYVSSGGMYLPGEMFPMPEYNPTKGADKNKQKAHEEFVMSNAIRPRLSGCAFFRPQYIVGPYTNKRDYLDWFFDRLTRDIPLPLPAPGTQTTTVTDARDVASMLASVVGKERMIADRNPVFNCASDQSLSLTDIVMICGEACGKTPEECRKLIKLYDPAAAKDAPSGGKFPFRATNFDVGVEKAKAVLGWEAQYNDFKYVASGYFRGYQALGLDKENPKMDTSFDKHVLGFNGTASPGSSTKTANSQEALQAANEALETALGKAEVILTWVLGPDAMKDLDREKAQEALKIIDDLVYSRKRAATVAADPVQAQALVEKAEKKSQLVKDVLFAMLMKHNAEFAVGGSGVPAKQPSAALAAPATFSPFF